MKMLGAGSSTAEWGYTFDLLIGHLRGLVDDEDYYSASKKRAKFIERADKAVAELEDILSEMEGK